VRIVKTGLGGGLRARPEGPMPQARRAESGGRVLGEGAASPLPQIGGLVMERCVLSHRGSGQSPGH